MGLLEGTNKYTENRVSEFDKVFLRQLGSTIREAVESKEDVLSILGRIIDRPFDGPSDSFYDLVGDMHGQLGDSRCGLQETLRNMAFGDAEYCQQAADVLREELGGVEWKRSLA